MSFITGFGLLQAILLVGLLLFTPRDPRTPNIFMAGLVLAIICQLAIGYVHATTAQELIPTWALFLTSLTFTWGPLLYLYTYSMTRRDLSWIQVLHFLPVLQTIWMITTYYSMTPAEQSITTTYIWVERSRLDIETQFQQIVSPLQFYWVKYRLYSLTALVHFGVYCLLILNHLRQNDRVLQSHYSSTEQLNLGWLRTLTSACLIYLIALLVLKRIPQVVYQAEGSLQDVPYVLLVGIIYLIVIAALKQPSILHGVLAAERSEQDSKPYASKPEVLEIQAGEDDSSDSEKYSRSSINLEDAQQFITQLMDATREQKLYLDSELTLPDLAAAANVTSHQVSQVLNGQLGQNFFTFINNYRIKHVKQLMSDPDKDNLAIVDLAFEVGFKSKSAFYTAFKNATGLTPAQYRKSLKDEQKKVA